MDENDFRFRDIGGQWIFDPQEREKLEREAEEAVRELVQKVEGGEDE